MFETFVLSFFVVVFLNKASILGHARRKFRRRLDPLSLTTPLNSMTKKLIFFYVTLLICFMSSLALTLIDHFVLSSNEALRAFIL